MLQLSKILLDICRLKAGPDALPRGPAVLILLVISAIVVDSAASAILIPALSALEVVITIAVYNLVLLTAVFILLKIVGYAPRALQTMSAIAGSGLVISLVLFPALLMIDSGKEQSQAIVLFVLIDNVWRIVVDAHIFRHAFSIGLLLAMVISLSYLLFGVMFAEFLLPAQTP